MKKLMAMAGESAKTDPRNFAKWAAIGAVFILCGFAAIDTSVLGKDVVSQEKAEQWSALIMAFAIGLNRSAAK